MARLNKAQKAYIVQSLAEFVQPPIIIQKFKELYGVEIKLQQIETYNPSRAQSANLGDEWINFFNECRKKYLEQPVENIQCANDIVQLEILSDLLLSKRNNVKAAIQIIDQIQKITKGHYEKRRIELTGPDGADLIPGNQTVTHVVATPEQIAEVMGKINDLY